MMEKKNKFKRTMKFRNYDWIWIGWLLHIGKLHAAGMISITKREWWLKQEALIASYSDNEFFKSKTRKPKWQLIKIQHMMRNRFFILYMIMITVGNPNISWLQHWYESWKEDPQIKENKEQVRYLNEVY